MLVKRKPVQTWQQQLKIMEAWFAQQQKKKEMLKELGHGG